jgi:cytochrome c oxidase subunit 3
LSANHHPALAHHFDDLEQQTEAGTLGMWLFLATEVMVFGGLFTAYIVYRYQYPVAFHEASTHLIWWLASINTAVLLTSSLTMALAVHAAATGSRRGQVTFLALTALLGLTFLVIKFVEYGIDYQDGLVPLRGMFEEVKENGEPKWVGASAAGVPYAAYVQQVKMFFVIYYIMTGLHATHMVIGLGLLSWLIVGARRGRFTPEYHPQVELTGLYWHFVDVIWIFLLPLLYLIGKAH